MYLPLLPLVLVTMAHTALVLVSPLLPDMALIVGSSLGVIVLALTASQSEE